MNTLKKLCAVTCLVVVLANWSHGADVKVSAMTPLTSGLTSNSLVSFSYIASGATNTRSMRFGDLLTLATTFGDYYNAYSSDGSSQQPAGTHPQSKLGLIGGDAAAMSGHPGSGDDIWHKGIVDPQSYVALWWVSGTNGGATQFTNEIRRWETNGFNYALTNAGIKPWLLIDADWPYQTRDGSGLLQANSNKFPNGLSPVIAHAKAHGFNVELGIYYAADLTNSAQVGVLGNYFSTTNVGYHRVAATTPITISKDMVYFYGLGIDSLRVADYSDIVSSAGLAGYNLQSMRQWSHYIKYPNGFDYSSYQSNRLGLSWFNGASFSFYPDIPLSVNVVNYDQPVGVGSLATAVTRGAYAMRHSLTNGSYAIGRGHFMASSPVSSFVSASDSDTTWKSSLTYGAMSSAIMQWHEAAGQAYYNTATNPLLLSVWFDRDYHAPWRRSDDGRNSSWIKPLRGGAYAVALFNESTTNTTFNVLWSDFNPPRDWFAIQPPPSYVNTNVAYQCQDVWANADLGTTYTGYSPVVAASNMLFFIARPRTDFAHLNGGNAFDASAQTFNGTLTVSNGIASIGASSGYYAYPRDGGGDIVLNYRDSTASLFKLAWSAAAYSSMLTFSNISGPSYLDCDSPYTVEFGRAGRFNYNAENRYTLKSNTVATWPTAPLSAGAATFANSNGVVYLLTSGVGATWTATNKIAP